VLIGFATVLTGLSKVLIGLRKCWSVCERAVGRSRRKPFGAGRRDHMKTRRRPTTGRASLNGRAPRSARRSSRRRVFRPAETVSDANGWPHVR